MRWNLMDNIDKEKLDKNLAGESFGACYHKEATDDARNLFNVICNDKNHNIALIGPYASGKSTIIQTLICCCREKKEDMFSNSDGAPKSLETEKHISRFKAQVISLAKIGGKTNISNHHVQDNVDDKNLNEEKMEKQDVWDDEIDNSIEKSILQQFVFSRKKSQLPASKIARLEKYPFLSPILIGLGIFLIAVFAVLFTFLLKEIPIPEDNRPFIAYACSASVNLILGLLLISFSVKGMTIKYKDLEITYEKNDSKNSESLFNKFLDEIIYYFKKTKVNTVFFEDLERFKNLEIFLKLRELNFLLNNSEELKKSVGKITFVYAINNDMFDQGTDRIKFFDYIYSVSPSFTPRNREELLYKALTEDAVLKWNDFDKKTISILSSYIDDRRMFLSVMNDLRYSWVKLDDVTKQQSNCKKQLLALTIYKNKHPRLYSDLEKGQGEVIAAVCKLKYELEKNFEKMKDKCQSLHNELNELMESYIVNLDYCYYLFIGCLFSKGQQYQRYYDNNVKQISKSEELYMLLDSDTVYFSCPNISSKITMDDLHKFIPELFTFLKTGKSKKTSAINVKRQELKKLTDELEHLPVDEFDMGVQHPECVNKLDTTTELLRIMLINGYIDHNYRRFLYSSMNGFLTESDLAFLKNIYLKKDYMFDLSLNDSNIIFDRLDLSYFSTPYVCNFDLIDYVFALKDSQNDKVKKIQLLLFSGENDISDFIGKYFENRKDKCNLRFLHFLLKNRIDVFEILHSKELDEITNHLLQTDILKNVDPVNIQKQLNAKETIQRFAKVANENGYYKEMTKEYVPLLAENGCIIGDLNQVSDLEVLDQVNISWMWTINYSNLSAICKKLLSNVTVDELLKKSFDDIKKLNIHLGSYLEEKIDVFAETVILGLPSLNLGPKMIKTIFCSSKVLLDSKIRIIEKQSENINYDADFDKDVIRELLKSKKLAISITNLNKIGKTQDANLIRTYLNDCFKQVDLTNSFADYKALLIKLLNNDSPLNLEIYNKYVETYSPHEYQYGIPMISMTEIKDTNIWLSFIDKTNETQLASYANHINSLKNPKVKARFIIKIGNRVSSTFAITPDVVQIVLQQGHNILDQWEASLKKGFDKDKVGAEDLINYVIDNRIDFRKFYNIYSEYGDISLQKKFLISQMHFAETNEEKMEIMKQHGKVFKDLIDNHSIDDSCNKDIIKMFEEIIEEEKIPARIEHEDNKVILSMN